MGIRIAKGILRVMGWLTRRQVRELFVGNSRATLLKYTTYFNSYTNAKQTRIVMFLSFQRIFKAINTLVLCAFLKRAYKIHSVQNRTPKRKRMPVTSENKGRLV